MPARAGQPDLFTRRVRRPPPAPEFSIHVMVADVLDRWASPGWRFTHFPSGELRNKITAARLQRMGLNPGWPDFILLSPAALAHFLELKRRGREALRRSGRFRRLVLRARLSVRDDRRFRRRAGDAQAWGAVRGSVHA